MSRKAKRLLRRARVLKELAKAGRWFVKAAGKKATKLEVAALHILSDEWAKEHAS